MWVEVFSTVCAAVSALLVGIVFYKKEHIGKMRLSAFVLSAAAVSHICAAVLPYYISVGAFVLGAALLCKMILRRNSITAFAAAMLTAFFHRVLMLIYFFGVYLFARERFTYGIRCFYSMLYALIFLNITAFASMWMYERYRNKKNESDLSAKCGEVEMLKNYTEVIENLLDEMQKSRHDYKNMILSLHDFVEEKRFDELAVYFEEEILKSEAIEKISKNIYLATKKIKQLPLKSLINAKLNEAMSGGIRVEITILSEIDITSVPTLDICRIIGNLLDNAVEAAQESDNKVISLIMLKNNGQYSITLCNGFSGEIDISRIWKKGYSSKGRNRGQGLPIVKKLVDSRPELLLNTEIKNNLFVQDLTITERKDENE